jgi:predicted DNA-binding WGR domain protein
MKLIKQTILVFQEGRSDKVYEIDLCEVGQNRYVVNFRYGRRGTDLKEGAKTTSPVALAEAEKVFAALVAEKTKKGYRDASTLAATTQGAKKAQTVRTTDDEARKQAVLKRFADENTTGIFKKKQTWSLDRAIWRAGELKIKEAAPLLLKFIGSDKALRDYCICWALGFCGDEESIPALAKLYQNAETPDMVKRMACEALLKLSDENTKAAFRDELVNGLPQELSYLARQGSAERFLQALNTYLQPSKHLRFAVLEKLYLIDNENVRPALLNLLRTAPMKPNYFKQIRHIFKAAEYRRDAEVFGIVAYRFEKSRAMFSHSEGLDKESKYYSDWVYIGGGESLNEGHIKDGRKEIRSEASRIGYGSSTRTYMRNRVWRTLRRLAEIGDLDYVKMAVGVLLPFSDSADAQTVKESHVYEPVKRNYVKVYWDTFASYRAFNQILYKNSPRYYLRRNTSAWRCKAGYRLGTAAPAAREEAYPQLWEKRPEGLLHLLAESNCKPVMEFAAKALSACEEFCANLDDDTIVMILERPFKVSARLGFKLAEARYNPASPSKVLTLAVANCSLDSARQVAHGWIQDGREYFLKDLDFITAIVFSDKPDTRAFARHLLSSFASAHTDAGVLATRLISELVPLDLSKKEIAVDVAETILESFPAQLRIIDLNVVLALLNHPMLAVQFLGGSILLNHQTQASDLPEAVITSLIASPFESLRSIGIQLFGKLNDETLINRDNVIAAFAIHELADIREGIRSVIHKLCYPPVQPDPRNEAIHIPVPDPFTEEQRKEFSLKISEHLLKALFEKETHEGVHSTLVKIMREDVRPYWMEQATQGTAWKLIHTKSQAAQELGGILIEYKLNSDALFANDFDFSDLVELSNHEVLAVRQASWALFSKMLHRLQPYTNPNQHLEEMAKAVKLLEAQWDDSRSFWFNIFEVHFTAENFTPGILVSICDSVRTDVQAFGRKLITRFFAEEDGQEYLLKLSEHPSANLQTFATNYLERYAAGDTARLESLKYYFVSVLSRVNKARVAKNRVIAFLTDEAQKSEAAARIVAEIFARQSVTMAVGDKASAIEAMLKIHTAFPHISLPIQLKTTEARNAF